MKMTNKQKMFVKEYLVDLNATQAAIRAGYSVKTAKVIANETLTKPYIQKALEKAMAERADRVSRTADDVLKDLLIIKNRAMDSDEKREALKALELEGKHYGMFIDRLKHEGDLTVNIVVPVSPRRGRK